MVSGLSSSRWNSSPPQMSHTPSTDGGSKSRCQLCPRLRHVRRPDSRLTTSSSSTTSSRTTSSGVPPSNSRSLNVFACGTLRGKPSSRNPLRASSSSSRDTTIPIVISSGTRSPASMYFLACWPSSVPWLTFARKMSPVEIFGIPRWAEMNWACGPFPAPGGPTRTRRITAPPLAEEALVVAQHQLALDLLGGVETHTDEDEHGGAAERERLAGACGAAWQECQRDDRQRGARRQVERPGQRDPRQDVLEVLRRRTARSDARDEAAVLAHVVADLDRVERDRDVEVGEEDRQQPVGQDVRPLGAAGEVGRDERRQPLVAGPDLGKQLREIEQRRREDDRDDTGLVDLQRDVGRCAAVHPPADHPFRVLHRDAALTLFHEDDRRDDHEPQHQHDDEGGDALGLQDLTALAGEARGDRGEDQQRHAVADAAVGDELAEPHDDGGAGGHDGHEHEHAVDRGGVEDRLLAVGEQPARHAAGQRHDAGGLQDRESDREVAGVLRQLGLAGLTLLLQPLQARDHHDEQLDDDAARDVGHDPERENGQLEQRAAAEQVDQAVDRGVLARIDAGVDVLVVDPRRGDDRAEPEQAHDGEREQDLLPKVRSAKRPAERPEHARSSSTLGGPAPRREPNTNSGSAAGGSPYSLVTLPPAAAILSAAVPEKAWALTCRATARSPLPRIFTSCPRRTAPFDASTSGSTSPPSGNSAERRSRFTTWYSVRNGFLKPLSLGVRMCSGIWPPSNASGTW